MSDKEFKLYDVIRRYYIAQFLGTYDYLARSATCVVNEYLFSANHNTPLKSGFKQAIADLNMDEQETPDELTLPMLKQGESADCIDTDVQSKKTKPPARFSEGTLIAAMKSIAKYVDDTSRGLGKQITILCCGILCEQSTPSLKMLLKSIFIFD